MAINFRSQVHFLQQFTDQASQLITGHHGAPVRVVNCEVREGWYSIPTDRVLVEIATFRSGQECLTCNSPPNAGDLFSVATNTLTEFSAMLVAVREMMTEGGYRFNAIEVLAQ